MRISFANAAVLLSLIAAAALAIASALDRASLQRPGLERLVPEFLRTDAARVSASRAIAAGNAEIARWEASRAIINDPAHPGSAALLGSAAVVAGNAAAAEPAFRVAARLGWRDRATQLYWYGAALEEGSWDLAIRRADAIMRTDRGFAQRDALLAPFEGDPQGRKVLAEAIGQGPVWTESYFYPSPDTELASLDRRAQVALAVPPTVSLDCGVIHELVTRLLAAGDRLMAQKLWNRHCPDRQVASGFVDSDFRQLAAGIENASPFGWRRVQRGDVLIRAQATGGVTMENTSSVSQLALTQSVALPPGAARFRATGLGAEINPAVVVSLDCGTRAIRPASVQGALNHEGQALRVPDCDTQTLGVWLRPGSGSVTIEALTID